MVGEAGFLPKKDSIPLPPRFFASVGKGGSSFPFSRSLQPGGRTMSWVASGRNFRDASHAVEPFEAR